PLVIRNWSDPWLWTSWVVLGMLLWITVAAARRRHLAIAFGLGWCFLTLIPVSNLVPIYNVIAERYLYLVSAGACLALAAILDGLPSRVGAAAAAGLIGAYAFGTIARNPDFRDDRTLFFQGGKRFVHSARLYCNRGALLAREGDPQAAIPELLQALTLHPRYAEAKIALGTALEALGLRAQALQSFQDGVSLAPRYPLPYFLLAEALRREHRTAEAREAYEKALALDPRFATAHLGLGLALAEEKK